MHAPPTYRDKDKRLCICMDMDRLVDWIEHGGLELPSNLVSQNLFLNFLGTSLHDSAILLREFICIVGSPYNVTGDKPQFSDPGHCKYIVRTWTMYLGKTQLVHHKYI